MGYRIFNVHTRGVNASGCTRGCTDNVRESALKADSGEEKKILLPHRRMEQASAVCRSNALPPELQPIPIFPVCLA